MKPTKELIHKCAAMGAHEGIGLLLWQCGVFGEQRMKFRIACRHRRFSEVRDYVAAWTELANWRNQLNDYIDVLEHCA